MELVHVIPISRGIGRETLSYFSARPLKQGSLVSVPLRKKEVPAIVLSTEDIGEAKTKIKTARFAVKKITARRTSVIFSPDFIAAAQSAAEHFATTTGAVLGAITPRPVLEQAVKKISWKFRSDSAKRAWAPAAARKMVLHAEKEDRLIRYKSLVREEFARGNSVFICVPTIKDTEKIEAFMKKGIEQFTFVLHGEMPKKELLSRFKKAVGTEHPILVIATGAYLSLPRSDFKTIIIEKENSRAFKTRSRPYIDFRVFAELLAVQTKARLIFSDLPLRVESVWRYREGELDEFAPLKLRSMRDTKQEIIDMRRDSKQKIKKFEVLGAELKELIKRTAGAGKNMFIFAARRGLAPVTVCGDCGNTVLCKVCCAPVALHRMKSENIFVCRNCSAARSAAERCQACKSWRLEALGVGIQYVESELNEHFKDIPVFTIDRDSASTDKKASEISEKFYDSAGAILLGTEMALAYLTLPVENSAVASMDSLLSIPDWRMSERILSILLSMKENTMDTMLIQTRKPESKILEAADKGNLTDYYRREIRQREDLGYPPFTTLIKITVIGASAGAYKEIENMKEKLKKYKLTVYPPLAPIGKGKHAIHGLLKIPRKEWPDRELLNILYSFPPSVLIDVNPESLL